MASERLPGSERLKGRNNYQRLMCEGMSVEDAYLVIRYLPRNDDFTKRHVGVAVSRSCRSAVERNRMRRKLREIYRRERNLLPQTGEFLLIAKSDALQISFADLTRSFRVLSHDLPPKSR